MWESEPRHPALPEQFFLDPHFLVHAVDGDQEDGGVKVESVEWQFPEDVTDTTYLPVPDRLVLEDRGGGRVTFTLEALTADRMSAADAVERLGDQVEFLGEP